MYKQNYNQNGSLFSIEKENEDGSVTYIPINEANSDYQRYLRWLENPNADDQPTTPNGVVTNGDN